MQIREIKQITPDIESLATQASSEEFNSIRRLVTEFMDGTNQFNRTGECLLGVYDTNEIIGIGGVNIDPYEPKSDAGRIRRFYIDKHWRRQGVGAALLQSIEERSKPCFPALQLFTPSVRAAAFYESMGYKRQNRYKVSHAKKLAGKID